MILRLDIIPDRQDLFYDQGINRKSDWFGLLIDRSMFWFSLNEEADFLRSDFTIELNMFKAF